MNKKIFTLLATSLMLLLTAIVVNAQVPGYYGLPVQYLPEGMGKGAYHLKVSSVGDGTDWAGYQWQSETDANAPLLAMDSLGYLKLFRDAAAISEYPRLREALWCVDVKKPEKLGQQPAYNFINKQHQALLMVDTINIHGGGWYHVPGGTDFYSPGDVSRTFSSTSLYPQRTGVAPNMHEKVFVGGRYSDWAFSHSYNTTALMQDQPLLIQIDGEKDMFLTFAYFDGAGSTIPDWQNVKLVKAHWDDVKPNSTSPFYKNFLVKFTLVNAAPRILTAEDFNTTLWNNPAGEYSQLFFDPDVKPASNVNVLAQKLHAEYAHGSVANKNYYMNFQTLDTKNWVYVADGDDEANWYNDENELYPIIKDNGKKADIDYNFDFRLVYYPSEDSLIINVAGLDHIKAVKGFNTDPGVGATAAAYDMGEDDMFNLKIYDYLLVRMQDLTSLASYDQRVITVADWPDNTRIHFGINDCKYSDDRTTVPPNLYVIRDSKGRYLAMPLEVGDFTPQWVYLKEHEDALKTPSYQWLVRPSNLNSDFSPVFMTNREFDWVTIEFAQIYKTWHTLKGNWMFTGWPDFAFDLDDGLIRYLDVSDEGWYGSFKIVEDDPAAFAKKKSGIPLTQDDWQKLYRTSPYLGYKYIHKDTLDWYTYSFNWLDGYTSSDYYLGIKNNQAKGDTTLYAENIRNHFQLILPNELDVYGEELYGIGYADSLLTYPSTRDIAKLQRYYYHFKENDYWNFWFDQNYLVIGDDKHYGFTPEDWADKRPLGKSSFYLRFTYQPPGAPEYYTLLDRIQYSDFTYLNNEFQFHVLPNIKIHDYSHHWNHSPLPHAAADSFGVLVLRVDPYNLFAEAAPKTVGGNPLSTFALSTETEPLYRRFNEGVYFFHGMNDSKADDGGVAANDDPRIVKIYRSNNEPKVEYLYEDRNSVNAYGKGINFLSLENIYDHNAWMNQDVNHYPHNFAFYLDTAYVNRGTGHIKPQYLIGVGPVFGTKEGCWVCGEEIKLRPWTYARYLINATDSAGLFPNNIAGAPFRDADYIWDRNFERLAFVPAIHVGDSLYILNGVDYMTFFQKDEKGEDYLHLASLIAAGKSSTSLVHIIPLDNNYHKDVVFSMRFIQRGNYEDFLLESETTNRDIVHGKMIAPMQGGWVKWQNGEMIITRTHTSYWDLIRDGERWNTEPTTDAPVANDKVAATAVKVIGGDGIVTILNAAGKRVTVSNVLGQTVAGSVLTSDNATISAPKGILVVAVEGESAVKTIVK